MQSKIQNAPFNLVKYLRPSGSGFSYTTSIENILIMISLIFSAINWVVVSFSWLSREANLLPAGLQSDRFHCHRLIIYVMCLQCNGSWTCKKSGSVSSSRKCHEFDKLF